MLCWSMCPAPGSHALSRLCASAQAVPNGLEWPSRRPPPCCPGHSAWYTPPGQHSAPQALVRVHVSLLERMFWVCFSLALRALLLE